jgi:5-(carboxyamino)imidazole ribonucleotide mutase
MPKGVPVATVAIGKAGAINAGYLAAQMLSTGNEEIAKKVQNLRNEQKETLKKENESL